MAREVLSHLAHLGPNGGRKKGKRKRKEKDRVLERERLYLLSKFPGNLTEGFRWSKRESLSSELELHIETGIGEF